MWGSAGLWRPHDRVMLRKPFIKDFATECYGLHHRYGLSPQPWSTSQPALPYRRTDTRTYGRVRNALAANPARSSPMQRRCQARQTSFAPPAIRRGHSAYPKAGCARRSMTRFEADRGRLGAEGRCGFLTDYAFSLLSKAEGGSERDDHTGLKAMSRL